MNDAFSAQSLDFVVIPGQCQRSSGQDALPIHDKQFIIQALLALMQKSSKKEQIQISAGIA